MHVLRADGAWEVFTQEEDFQEANMLSIQYRFFLPMGKVQSSHFYIEFVYEMNDASGIQAKEFVYRLAEDSSSKNRQQISSPIPPLRIHCMHPHIKLITKAMMSNLIKMIEIKCSIKIQSLSSIILFCTNDDKELQGRIHHIRELGYIKQSKQEDSSLFSSESLRKSNASVVTDSTTGSLKKFHCKGDFCQYVEEQEVEYDDGQLGSIKVEVAKVPLNFTESRSIYYCACCRHVLGIIVTILIPLNEAMRQIYWTILLRFHLRIAGVNTENNLKSNHLCPSQHSLTRSPSNQLLMLE